MRHILVGDVHGCLQELKELLLLVGFNKLDKLIFLGDLIHKGPDSNGVLEYIHLLKQEYYDIVVLLGNHEEKQIRWWGHEERKKRLGIPNPTTHTEGYEEISDDHSLWGNTLGRGGRLYYKGPGWIATHAGIPHNLRTTLPRKMRLLDVQAMPKKQRTAHMGMLRVRYETPQGELVKMGAESPDDIYWANRYDGRYGYCYFGHQTFPTDQMFRHFSHATPLDYGCVHGGALVAVVIDHDGKETFHTVPAAKVYQPYCEFMQKNP